MDQQQPRARVSMLIAAPAAAIYRAFIEPEGLTKFWLTAAAAPLAVGKQVKWDFMVKDATVQTTATRLDPNRRIEWQWSDGSTVRIELESFEEATAVTLVHENFSGDREAQFESALNATEGFTIVLADLKTVLELGRSAGLTKSKARLIEARRSK